MATVLILFEDKQVKNLFPLTYTRPVYDLRCGILTLGQKIRSNYPGVESVFFTRGYLKDVVKQNHPTHLVNELPENVDKALFVNGRVLENNLAQLLPLEGEDAVYKNGDVIIAARLSGENLKKALGDLTSFVPEENLQGFPEKETEIKYVTYQWDLVSRNGEQIIVDFDKLVDRSKPMNLGKVYAGVNMIQPNNIFIDEGAKVKPGVVLDAEEGPIYIAKGATVMANAVIEGPCYIGEKTKIKVAAKIYENTSIGPVCKVGGEVEESIIHSYSNKQHDGFLGHAYLGQWVNLGADTNNSDLKNNYGNVKVFINDEPVDSGSMFVGLTMGDHSKSGINTMFNTGTVVGFCANVFGGNFPPKYIPSFAWGGAESMQTYDLQKAMQVAERVMARRDIKFTEADKALFTHIFEMTKAEREKRNM